MAAALEYCRGLRVIRQPAWECLATFITSSMKQVAHIAQISHVLRRRFGRRLDLGGLEMFAYPAAERMAERSEAELRECALGYRAGNLLKTARMIAEGTVELEAIRALPDEEARAELMRFPGVGEKVANCVLLFAYERVRAFPIDVWIERVLREAYFKGKRKVTAKRLRDFSRKYFGEFGGYAQQYLFHHARSQKRRRVRKAQNERPPTPFLDVVLSPAEIDLLPQRELGGATAVVFDILRATSTMVTALAHGAAGIYPARTIEEAWALREKLPEALLGGERHGDRIEGFDLGNSPLEYRENVRGRTIISTTTNGTIGLRACEGAREVLAGFVSEYGRRSPGICGEARPAEIVLVCAGTFREAALEDILAAGLLASLLPGARLTDAAQLALALWRQHEGGLPAALRLARNGRALLAKGRGAELDWCAQTSIYPLLAPLEPGGCIRGTARKS